MIDITKMNKEEKIKSINKLTKCLNEEELLKVLSYILGMIALK